MPYYKAFGLIIAADLAIRELLPIEQAEPDVVIHAGAVSSLEAQQAKKIFLPIKNVASFFIQNGNEIIYHKEEAADLDNFRLYLLGSAMGALLQQRGFIVLHGNAVSMNGKECSIFVGHTGAGKSTMAAYCLKQGARILADDVCAISFDSNGKPWVTPSYPQIKIWKNTADLLHIDTTHLPRVRPQDEKYALKIDTQFCREPLPLETVFEIDPQATVAQEVVGLAKFQLLLAHSYRAHFLQRMDCDKAYLKQLTYLSSQIRIEKAPRRRL